MQALLTQIVTDRRVQIALLGIGGGLLAVLVGYNVTLGLMALFLGLAIAGLAIVFFGDPRLGIAIVVFLFLFQDWLVYGVNLLPDQFPWLTDGLVILLWVRAVIERIRSGSSLRKSPIDYLVIALAVASILSVVANSLSMAEAVFGFRLYFKFFFLYYAIVYMDLDEVVLRQIVTFFVIAAALSIPIVFVNYSIWGANDLTGGGIGLKAALSLLFNIVLIILLSAWMVQRGLKIHWALIAVGQVLPWVLGSVVAAFYYFPAVVLFVSRRLFNWRYLIVLPILAAVYVAGVIIYPQILPANALQRLLFSPTETLEELQGSDVYGGAYGEAGLRRLPAIQFANNLVKDNPLTFLVGFGPSTFTATTTSVSSANSLYKQFIRENLAKQQLPQAISEMGYLGVGLMILIILRLFWINNQLLGEQKEDPFWYGVFVAFEAALVMFIALAPYQSTWTSNVSSVLFWMLAALVSKKWLASQAEAANVQG